MSSNRSPLVVLSGLPGVGKSTLATALCSRVPAVLVRVDELEGVMRRTGIEENQPIGLAAYTVGEVMAERCLLAGCGAVVDAVNAVEPARQQWRELGRRTDAVVCVVEVVCSDEAEHRRRVESRTPDPKERGLPTWEEVVAREYEPWHEERLVINTCAPGEHASAIHRYIEARLPL